MSGAKGGPVIRYAWGSSPFLAVSVFGYVVLAQITLLGVLTGLLVQTVRTTAMVEKESSMIEQINAAVDEVWQRVIGDAPLEQQPRATEAELQSLTEDEDLVALCCSLDVDWAHFLESILIFQTCRDEDGKVAKRDFKKILLDLRGSEPAKVKHHVETRKFVYSLFEDMVQTAQISAAAPLSLSPLVRHEMRIPEPRSS